jgi:hypothetical protein
MERLEAHQILTEHLAEHDRRWLWLRWRCATCGDRYPCLLRRGALAELAQVSVTGGRRLHGGSDCSIARQRRRTPAAGDRAQNTSRSRKVIPVGYQGGARAGTGVGPGGRPGVGTSAEGAGDGAGPARPGQV